MKMRSSVLLLSLGLMSAGAAFAQDGWEKFLDQVRIKQAIADTLTPAQLEARREMLARMLATQAANPTPRVGSDTCPLTTNEVGTLPFNIAGTTLGQVDDYDLPADTTNPTCAAAVTCTGGGPAGSLPRGAIYTGTGQGPDFAYRIRTDAACTLDIAMASPGEDKGLIVYPTTCSSLLADCGCVDDVAVAGGTENISLTTVANTDYFVAIDGYLGSSGPFSVAVTVTAGACQLVGATPTADLSITKDDGVATIPAGENTTYTITASNAGPSAVVGAPVSDTFPAECTSVNWTCTAAGGGNCQGAAGTGNISANVDLPVGASVTYSAICAVSGTANGASLVNTATVAAPVGTIDSNGANNSATDTNMVTAALIGNLVITPTAVPFGNQAVGTTSAAQIVTLSNNGTGTVTVSTLTAAAAPFALSGGTCTAVPISIAPAANCTLEYTFAPTTAVASAQTLTVTANAPATGSGTIDLSGTGVAGALAVSSPTVAFGNQLVGSTSLRTLTISNTGGADLQITSISAVTAPFTTTAGGTCAAAPFTLAAGASCTVIYSFLPTAAGDVAQVVTIASSVGNLDVTLSGRGVVAVALDALSTVGGGLLMLLLVLGTVVVVRRR